MILKIESFLQTRGKNSRKLVREDRKWNYLRGHAVDEVASFEDNWLKIRVEGRDR